MPGVSLDDELAARIADDSGHDPNRHVSFSQNGSLLDVELEERLRERIAARHERTAPDASHLLTAEHDHGAGVDPLDGIDRGDDPERAVEAAAARHGVEMRAGPDELRPLGMSEEVAVTVDLDSEPRLVEP